MVGKQRKVKNSSPILGDVNSPSQKKHVGKNYINKTESKNLPSDLERVDFFFFLRLLRLGFLGRVFLTKRETDRPMSNSV